MDRNIDFVAIGKRIQTARKAAGLTQEELAAKIGISQNSYSDIELGKSRGGFDKFIAISDILKISLDTIAYDVTFSDSNAYLHALSIEIKDFSAVQKAMLNDCVSMIKKYKISGGNET